MSSPLYPSRDTLRVRYENGKERDDRLGNHDGEGYPELHPEGPISGVSFQMRLNSQSILSSRLWTILLDQGPIP
jgi:hypothetical protein